MILMAVLLLVPPVSVSADAVMGNEFEWEHHDELQRLERSLFVVNGPDGYVILREEPGSSKEAIRSWWSSGEVISFDNGTIVYMDSVYVYEDEYWGVMQTGHHVDIPGWILMDELLMYYDSQDFIEEHEDELYGFSGSIDRVYKAEEFYLWQWPGSDRERILYTVDEDNDLEDEYAIRTGLAYMDDNGREWVYVILWNGFTSGLSRYGSAEGWTCLDDLANAGNIEAFNPAPESIKWSPDGNNNWSSDSVIPPANTPPDETPTTNPEYSPVLPDWSSDITSDNTLFNIGIILIIISVLVLAVTLIIIFIINKRKK